MIFDPLLTILLALGVLVLIAIFAVFAWLNSRNTTLRQFPKHLPRHIRRM